MLIPQGNQTFSIFDAQMMARAIKLAQRGIYSTTPNPHVGCVITNANNEIIGEGFHQKAGGDHAEVVALEQAEETTTGATAYVTLEPCAHYGKTPPCAQALIDAKVSKVIVACIDPNNQVSGKGIAMLQKAGIEVKLGLMKQTALALNKTFFFALAHDRPYVSVKLAASLDGKTALENGQSKWITSPQARKDVQTYRAQACAIFTGTDTVIADNPQLNVRPDELPSHIKEQFLWRKAQPLRVIVDSGNRLSANTFIVFNDAQPTLVYNLCKNDNLPAIEGVSYCQQQVPAVLLGGREFVDLRAVMSDLKTRGINHLWVEAGEHLTGALLNLALVDELVLYQAPKILGQSARGLTCATSKSTLEQALTGKIESVSLVGPDTKTVIEFSH